MKRNSSGTTAVLCALAMAALILDTKTALKGASEGITLCLQTVIPSLFPFLLLSMMLTSAMIGRQLTIMRPICKLLRLPKGAGAIFAVGMIGGYPVGAQSITQAYEAGQISTADARRMMAFCSNAGPAFLFGIGCRLFPDMRHCWLIWLIHIMSAIFVGIITPGVAESTSCTPEQHALTLTDALSKAIRTMSVICGWIVIFRVLMAFLTRWVLWFLPYWAQCFVCGLLELTNGCVALVQIPNIGLRLSLFTVFLGFGGICISMQTRFVAGNIDRVLYLPGKIAQATFSFLLCIPAQFLLPEAERYMPPMMLIVLSFAILISYGFYAAKQKNSSSIPLPVSV